VTAPILPTLPGCGRVASARIKTRFQTVPRPSGPLTRAVLVDLLRQLGDEVPSGPVRGRRKPAGRRQDGGHQ